MNSIITITERNGQQVVSARELHSYLGNKKQFADWMKHRITRYGLIENQDYVSYSPISEKPLGGRPEIDFALTLNAAKELSMVESTKRGKEARQYFIACEKKALQPQEPLSTIQILEIAVQAEKDRLALEEKNRQIESENENLKTTLEINEKIIEEQKPKVESFDTFISSEMVMNMEAAAKSLGKGRNKMFDFLRNVRLLQPNKLPYQKYLNQGLFQVKQTTVTKGEKVEYYQQTFVTPKGLDYIRKLLSNPGSATDFRLIN